MVRKRRRRAIELEYNSIDTSLKSNPNALEQVKAWVNKYITNDINQRLSIDDYTDYLSNYEALLVLVEEDGVAKEDFFSFNLLDDV